MYAATAAVLFALIALASAHPTGIWGLHGVHDDGQYRGEGLLESGAFGPGGAGLVGHHDGQWRGEGIWESGAWGGHGIGLHGGHSDVVHAGGATLIGASATGAGVGAGLGWGHGLGHGAVVLGHGGHGVGVIGPATGPAVVSGPSGHIVASGIHGVAAHGGHHW